MAKLKRVIKLKDHQKLTKVTDLPGPRLTEESAESAPADPEFIVRLAIAEHFDLPPSEVSGDEHLYIDLGVDDAQLPRLLNRMGEALDVRFPDDFFDGVQTVAQLTAAVRVSLSPL